LRYAHLDSSMRCMFEGPAPVQRTYLLLTALSTLAASCIWGVNTLFLLDAGLRNSEAFAANAFFTAGQVLFEIPTGVVADTWGRRASYLLGAGTLLVTTFIYFWMWRMHAPLWAWAIGSALIGLGFTFFSGATEAWLVDALEYTGQREQLDRVLARGQVVTGGAMLAGSVGGGFLAQATNLGAPYLLRSALLALTLMAAALWMRDLGFTPSRDKSALMELQAVLRRSLEHGWRNPLVRSLMLAGFASGGVGIYGFYAAQPYLLQLYGDAHAFGVTGLATAIVAGMQMLSGAVAPQLHKLFSRRSHVLLASALVSAASLCALAMVKTFAAALGVLIVWSFAFWITVPTRQTLLNGAIPSAQRATVLSFDSLMTAGGGAVAQAPLGRAADIWGYPFSYLLCAGLQLCALPFLILTRRQNAASDPIEVAPP
jgi:MFS family permease